MGNSVVKQDIQDNKKIVDDYLLHGMAMYPELHDKIVTKKGNAAEDMVDESREYKDLCTDIVNKIFLSSDGTMFNFLNVVYSSFSEAIDQYKNKKGLDKWDIFFVYKGGNILRIISNDFLKELPFVASRDIHKYYDKFFKRSDADFSIYINPQLSTYNEVYQDMSNLSYLLQVNIRNIFLEKPCDYFDYFKYTNKYARTLMANHVSVFKNSQAVKDAGNKTYYGDVPEDIIFVGDCDYTSGPDILIKFEGSEKITSKQQIGYENSHFFIQQNETLDFKSSAGRVRFNLIRTKALFNLIFTDKSGHKKIVPMGGELIDVSIPNRVDNNLIHFYEVGVDYIQSYKLSKNDSPDVLEFLSYKYDYLSHDLEYILFKFVSKPWLTPKYEKRLNRLVYLYYIDLFVKLDKMIERKNAILDFHAIISKSITSSASDDLLAKMDKYIAKYSSLLIVELMTQVKRIITKELNGSDDLSEYRKFVDTILVNCNQINKSFKGIKNYCSDEGNVDLDVLYDNEFSSLIGGAGVRPRSKVNKSIMKK